MSYFLKFQLGSHNHDKALFFDKNINEARKFKQNILQLKI